jgi:hypothetical protein
VLPPTRSVETGAGAGDNDSVGLGTSLTGPGTDATGKPQNVFLRITNTSLFCVINGVKGSGCVFGSGKHPNKLIEITHLYSAVPPIDLINDISKIERETLTLSFFIKWDSPTIFCHEQ